MKTWALPTITAALTCLAAVPFAAAANDKDSVVSAVFSRSFNKYERPTRADGSDRPLTYVVAKGGLAEGMSADDSLDDVKFTAVVRVLGKYLAKQSYYPAKDAKKADLMLVVHWGKTIPGNDAQFRTMLADGISRFDFSQQLGGGVGAAPGSRFSEGGPGIVSGMLGGEAQGLLEIRFWQDVRDEANRYNANLLGYTGELNYRNVPTLYAGAGTAYYELIEDLESERYYVTVTAYDFQEALKHKNKKGLWRTVASIDARDNRFDERLVTMIDQASKYFGRDSGRLIRQFDYTPHIKLGELKTMGVVDAEPSEQK